MRLYLSSFRLGNQPDALVELVDKPGACCAAICNADDYKTPEDRVLGVQRELDDLESLGFETEEVDLRDHFGDAGGLRRRLESFDLVWVRGGNTFLLRRALAASGGDNVLAELITGDRLVYAGYSAGALVLGPTLRGIEDIDDPTVVPEGYAADVVWDGLRVVPYCVLPHFRSDHPESAATSSEGLERYLADHVPFIALRDGEAIVRRGDDERVVG
jgi:dipeptidase E